MKRIISQHKHCCQTEVWDVNVERHASLQTVAMPERKGASSSLCRVTFFRRRADCCSLGSVNCAAPHWPTASRWKEKLAPKNLLQHPANSSVSIYCLVSPSDSLDADRFIPAAQRWRRAQTRQHTYCYSREYSKWDVLRFSKRVCDCNSQSLAMTKCKYYEM